MTIKKKIGLGLCIGIVAIQFFQPARNKSDITLPADIEKLVVVPSNISGILKTSCYDCHSNNTAYPWYSFIQPVASLMASHIKQGKASLNFNEFGTYSNRRQQSKLQAIINSINDNSMPLDSYLWLHKNAVLSSKNKAVLLAWLTLTKDSLSQKNLSYYGGS